MSFMKEKNQRPDEVCLESFFLSLLNFSVSNGWVVV